MIPLIKLTKNGEPFYVNVDAIAYVTVVPSSDSPPYKSVISFNGRLEDEHGVDQTIDEVYKLIMSEGEE